MRFFNILLPILFLTVFTCEGQIKKPAEKNTKAFRSFYAAIRRQFKLIDSLNAAHKSDPMEAVNKNLSNIIRSYRTDIFNFPDTLDYDMLYITKSSDHKLALVSWDTRLGGTQIAFTTMAVFKTDKGIRAEMIIDSSNAVLPYSYVHYNSVHTIHGSDAKTIYLAWGTGQGSTALPEQEICAFSIVNNQLIKPRIFPGKESGLYVEFDLHAFPDDNPYVPSIKVRNKGRLIKVPMEGDHQGFSGKYKTYVFNGKAFHAK